MQKVSKQLLITAFILLFFLGSYTSTFAKPTDHQPSIQRLQDLANSMNDQDAEITYWSLYGRENLDTIKDASEFYKQAKGFKQDHQDVKWDSIKKKDGQFELTGRKKLQDHHVNERISLFAYPHKGQYRTYLIYEINGQDWNKKMEKELFPIIKIEMSEILHKNAKIFSCIKAQYNAKMEIALSTKANKILHYFSANTVEETKEKTFVSVSAYNDKWKDHIVTDNKKMNLQVALRTVGEITTITLGTPIITTEY